MSRFARFLAVDWSGAKGATAPETASGNGADCGAADTTAEAQNSAATSANIADLQLFSMLIRQAYMASPWSAQAAPRRLAEGLDFA